MKNDDLEHASELERTLIPGLACTVQLWRQWGDQRTCIFPSLPWSAALANDKVLIHKVHIHVALSPHLLPGDNVMGYDVKVTRITLWGDDVCPKMELPWCRLGGC